MGMSSSQEMLDRMLDPVTRCLNADAARRIVSLRADPEAQRRMDVLAEKCNEGSLSPEERAEYEAYVAATNLVAVLQAKARIFLANSAA